MDPTKEEIKEWHQNPTTRAIKKVFEARILELKEPRSFLMGTNKCELIALATMEKAGKIDGIREVLEYEGN